MAWTPTTYDLISRKQVTDHHKACLKMRARNKQTATKENARCWCLIVQGGKTEKNPRGPGSGIHHSLSLG